jgi:hypothetical protein
LIPLIVSIAKSLPFSHISHLIPTTDMAEETKEIKTKEIIYLVKTKNDPKEIDVIFKDKKKAELWISNAKKNEMDEDKYYYDTHYDELKDEYPDFNAYWESGNVYKYNYYIESYLLDDYYW